MRSPALLNDSFRRAGCFYWKRSMIWCIEYEHESVLPIIEQGGWVRSYEEFWPFYLSQHSKPDTRRCHFIGTSFVFLFIIVAVVTWNVWWLLAAPVTAYAFAWFSHFFIEGNKPATFGHPLWSLRADFRMYRMMLLGQLEKEFNKLTDAHSVPPSIKQ
jgi:hypothetical protein